MRPSARAQLVLDHSMRLLLAFCLVAVLAEGPGAQQVTFTPIAQGFEFATDLQFAPGGEEPYVTGQSGLISVVEGSGPRPVPFLDLRDRVVSTGEAGLLSMAFDPQWPADPYVYVHYTRALATSPTTYEAVFSRFQADPVARVGDPGSEMVLLRITKPYAGPDQSGSGHQGGSIAFGNDGYLYVTVGEAQQREFAQDRASLLGKVLRLDVNGGGSPLDCGAGTGAATVPPGNPFAGGPGGDCDELYAYGFRNPWRMSMDTATGTFWIGDVGEGAWEEIDVLAPGANYGWPVMEGNHCSDTHPGCDATGITLPVWEYPRSEGQAITGGFVYRGATIPWLQGRYVYGDFVSGRVWALDPVAPANEQIGMPGELITSFGRNTAGELYLLNLLTGIFQVGNGTVGTTDAPASGDLELAIEGSHPIRTHSILRATAGRGTDARVLLVDVTGRRAATLFEGRLEAGVALEIPIDATRLAAGVYSAQLITPLGRRSLRLVVTR